MGLLWGVPTATETIFFPLKKCWQPWAYVTTTHCHRENDEGLSGRSSKHLRTTCASSHLPSLSTWAWRCGFPSAMDVGVGRFFLNPEEVVVWLVWVGWNPCFCLQTRTGRNTGQFMWDIHTFFYINCCRILSINSSSWRWWHTQDRGPGNLCRFFSQWMVQGKGCFCWKGLFEFWHRFEGNSS